MWVANDKGFVIFPETLFRVNDYKVRMSFLDGVGRGSLVRSKYAGSGRWKMRAQGTESNPYETISLSWTVRDCQFGGYWLRRADYRSRLQRPKAAVQLVRLDIMPINII